MTALLRAICDCEARGDHERAQRLRDGLRARQTARQPDPPDEPPPAAPAVPLAASPPLTREQTIQRLCALYGSTAHADYLVRSNATPEQAVIALEMLGGKPNGR